MTKVEEARNAYIDAVAKLVADISDDDHREYVQAARHLMNVKAAETPQRTGWFTAYVYPRTKKDVRLRRELRENGLVHSESGRLVANGLDPYIDIQWEGDERTYTEEEIRKAWIYSENVYSWKAFQRELHKGENE